MRLQVVRGERVCFCSSTHHTLTHPVAISSKNYSPPVVSEAQLPLPRAHGNTVHNSGEPDGVKRRIVHCAGAHSDQTHSGFDQLVPVECAFFNGTVEFTRILSCSPLSPTH